MRFTLNDAIYKPAKGAIGGVVFQQKQATYQLKKYRVPRPQRHPNYRLGLQASQYAQALYAQFDGGDWTSEAYGALINLIFWGFADGTGSRTAEAVNAAVLSQLTKIFAQAVSAGYTPNLAQWSETPYHPLLPGINIYAAISQMSWGSVWATVGSYVAGDGSLHVTFDDSVWDYLYVVRPTSMLIYASDAVSPVTPLYATSYWNADGTFAYLVVSWPPTVLLGSFSIAPDITDIDFTAAWRAAYPYSVPPPTSSSGNTIMLTANPAEVTMGMGSRWPTPTPQSSAPFLGTPRVFQNIDYYFPSGSTEGYGPRRASSQKLAARIAAGTYPMYRPGAAGDALRALARGPRV